MSLGLRYHAKYIIFKQDILILLKKASFLAIFTTGIGTRAGADSNENEPEPESLSLVVKKEPKSESGGDSKAGITPALVHTMFSNVSSLSEIYKVFTDTSVIVRSLS